MKDISKLRTQAQHEKFWTMNNIIYQDMSKEPESISEATKLLLQIQDAKYKKTDFRAIMENNYKHLSASEQSSLLEIL